MNPALWLRDLPCRDRDRVLITDRHTQCTHSHTHPVTKHARDVNNGWKGGKKFALSGWWREREWGFGIVVQVVWRWKRVGRTLSRCVPSSFCSWLDPGPRATWLALCAHLLVQYRRFIVLVRYRYISFYCFSFFVLSCFDIFPFSGSPVRNALTLGQSHFSVYFFIGFYCIVIICLVSRGSCWIVLVVLFSMPNLLSRSLSFLFRFFRAPTLIELWCCRLESTVEPSTTLGLIIWFGFRLTNR